MGSGITYYALPPKARAEQAQLVANRKAWVQQGGRPRGLTRKDVPAGHVKIGDKKASAGDMPGHWITRNGAHVFIHD